MKDAGGEGRLGLKGGEEWDCALAGAENDGKVRKVSRVSARGDNRTSRRAGYRVHVHRVSIVLFFRSQLLWLKTASF